MRAQLASAVFLFISAVGSFSPPLVSRPSSIHVRHISREEAVSEAITRAAADGESKQAHDDGNEKEKVDCTVRVMTLSKPMGLILEENDENNPNSGVRVVQMSGAAALASQQGKVDLCLGDALVSVEGMDCTNWTFDQVMDKLVESPSPIEVGFSRPNDLVAVRFVETGMAVAAKPKTPLKPLGQICGAESIKYSCNVGDCAVCEQELVAGGKSRFVRMCVGKVPKGNDQVTIVPNTDR